MILSHAYRLTFILGFLLKRRVLITYVTQAVNRNEVSAWPAHFLVSDTLLLDALAGQMSFGLQKHGLVASLALTENTSEHFTSALCVLNSAPDLPTLLRQLSELLRIATGAQACYVFEVRRTLSVLRRLEAENAAALAEIQTQKVRDFFTHMHSERKKNNSTVT